MSQPSDSKTEAQTASNLRLVSIGQVAANKLRGSWDIEVTLLEKLPFIEGENTDNAEEKIQSGKGLNGAAYSAKGFATTTVRATWWPGENTNRRTAPDVRRNEIVSVFQFGDSDAYYWTTSKDGFHLRRLETVTYAWSADANNPPDPKKNNCYYFEVSTHDGLVTFHTSKANGERTTFDMQYNTKEGLFTLTDDEGNYFHINTDRAFIELRNSRGSLIQLNGENGLIKIPKNLTLDIGGDLIQRIAGSVLTKAGNDVSTDAGSRVTTKAPSIVEDAANINMQGNISSGGGSFGGDGQMQIGGHIRAKTIETSGRVRVNDTLSAQHVQSDTAIDAPNVK